MERVFFGKVREGDVEKLSFRAGRFHFSVITYGAALCEFGFDDVNLVLNHRSGEDYERIGGYLGAVVGPYANRIKNAEFTLDGRRYQLDKNNNGNNLHSGSACFGRKLWSVIGVSENSVTLALSTPALLGGFPGKHEASVTYLLTADGALTIEYRISSDQKCPVAVTNHAYFNLNGRESTVHSHIVTLGAESFVDVDELLIPVAVRPVEGTDFDFRTPHALGERRGGAYDNTFVTEGGMIRCEGERAIMDVLTTEPGVQMYTGEFLSDDHKPFEGVCFETGRYPDTPNHPEYPAAYTENGRDYISATTFRLTVK